MKYILRLYIAGSSHSSSAAIAQLEEICKNHLSESYQLEVIDVLENPEMAEKDKVIATPTLIRELPPPLRKIIGSLTERQKLLIGLDLIEADRLTQGENK
ncbi:circadian clock KaiB family protein [Tritonibacter horizontis]|uniref:Circadian clock protein KaiB n=1 Tax=Tritonibacter horizontis TaxID=1768241 RepID=A0A132BQ78_9RHOB|nr:circadian clock KaiB family protein [Tritonibacter horizontis]KUP90563.1 circadian clock protein KaiB [Tritonibacter horizontis]